MLIEIGTINREPTATTSETINAYPEEIMKKLGLSDAERRVVLKSLYDKHLVQITTTHEVAGLTKKGRKLFNDIVSGKGLDC